MFFLLKKNGWLFFLFVFLFAYLYSQEGKRGWVILLDGTSSAGKTSVARELMKQLDEKHKNMKFQYESHDDFLTRQEKEEAEASKSKSKNSHDDKNVSKKSISKSISVSHEDADDDEDDDDSLVDYFDYLDDLVTEGHNIVADIVLRDDQDLKDCFDILKKNKILHVLVYCPVLEIVERVTWRNRSGIKDEERTLHQAIDQVPDMFIISHSSSTDDVDSITKSELENILKKLKQELQALNKKNKAVGKEQKNVSEIVRSMRKRYGFSKRHNKVYIRQKFIHDVVVINSKTIPLQSSARKISEALGKRVQEKIKSSKVRITKRKAVVDIHSLQQERQATCVVAE